MTGCICGHDPAAHEHYRAGTDCSACPADLCPEFVPQGHRPPVSPGLLRALAVLTAAVVVPGIVVAAMAAHTYLGGWAAAGLLVVLGVGGVWLVVRPERADRSPR